MVARKKEKVVIDDVSKVYYGVKTVKALEGITCSIEESEFAALLGPSGCGKTTLLNIIAGLDKPTRGKVYLDREEIKGPGLDRGYVFQEYALFPWLDVFKNIEFGLKRQKIPSEERRKIVEKYIKLVGLEEFKNVYPHQLSGGMRQKVAIARALAINPEVLLMDEPFGSLDAQTRIILQEELLRLIIKNKKTVVFVTHSVDEAIYLAQKIYVFTKRPGRIKLSLNVEDYIDKEKYNFDRIKIMNSPKYGELHTKLWETIKEEIVI